MGIFGGKKTFVSSVVYNLAGDEFKRPNYLKTTVVSATLNNTPSIAESITDSYLNGPGMKFRRFYQWADRTEYNNLIGLVTGSIQTGNSIDTEVLLGEIPGATLLQSASIGPADYMYWVDQYVFANFPHLIDTSYTADIDETTSEITITWADGSMSTFTPVDYDKTKMYLYAVYHDTAMQVFIYQQGSGNPTLDAMFLASSSEMMGFYPVIPLRLENEFLSEEYQPEIYEQARKGYKKATTGKLDKLIEQLEENEDIEDIDYIYIVFGVCLNVLEQASRKYIYMFFEEILNDFLQVGDVEHATWQAEWTTARDSWETWVEWREAQSDSGNPLYGTTEPERLTYPPMPANSIQVSTGANPTINYDMTISWVSMSEQVGTGLLKPGAKPDQLWFSKGDASYNEELIWVEDGEDDFGNPVVAHAVAGARTDSNAITLNWQLTNDTWRRLTIVGLKHRNLIYGGKAVEIDAYEALDDPEESGFIIPLHDGVFRLMGLKDGTQMTTACSFLVFNCYEVVKQRWYETGLFRIVLVIIVVVITYFTGGLGASAGGILGTNTAVGTAILGTTASAAAVAIVGAVANAIAAMLVLRIVTEGSVALFGEKWGAVIGAVLSIVALNVGSAMANGQSFASAFGNLMRADNLLQLTSAVGNGYTAYMQGATAEVVAEQQAAVEEYNQAAREIRSAWEQNLGGEGGIIDPRVVTSAFSAFWESHAAFLDRTLMTGSDIADMSLDMLTNFAQLTINTDLPT